ncbi:MAG: RluA family pseudouridine synthase, partial [Nannocystaceae bacterium]
TWPRMVHRLDLATSGLLIAPKHRDAYVHIQRQFAARTISKRYVALVHGQLVEDRGVIDFPIGRDLADRPRQQRDPIHGKPAITRWQVIERASDHTRVALIPETGRTHQLRVHAAHPEGLNAPIVGDRLYGLGGERLMLHAAHLRFTHPTRGAQVEFESPPPF